MTQKLTSVSETLLIALYAKFPETQRQDGLLKDEKVIDIAERLNCDFGKFSKDIWSSQTY